MGWETTVSESPCFCGKGTLVSTSRSDDWGRSESSEELRCTDCAKKYVLAQVRGRDDRPLRWITRQQFDQMETARVAAAQEREDAIVRAREELGDAFVAALIATKSRKRIWQRLREARIESWSLGSFAAFNRSAQSRGMPATLRLMIDERNADTIRTWLGIEAKEQP